MDIKEIKRKEYFRDYYLRKKELLKIHQKKRGRPRKSPIKFSKVYVEIPIVLNFN